MKIVKIAKGKFKCYGIKLNKSKNYDRGYGAYIVYYRNHSYDIYNVYSPKAAIRVCRKLINKGLI